MRIVYFSLCLFCSVGIYAQNKINLNGLRLLSELKSEAVSRSSQKPSAPIEAIVTLKPGWNNDILNEYGASIVLTLSETMYIMEIPADRMEAFAQSPDVDYVEFGNIYNMTMDFARPASGVTGIQQGFEYGAETLSFTGAGVVTGLMDQGIDPNHVNFKNAAGTLRVKEVYNYDTNESATAPVMIRRFKTDDNNETHGTHVAGIMAGAYNGDGEYYAISGPSAKGSVKYNGNVPYYGIATGSDIVMASGSFTSSNIIKGVKAVIDYAESKGMPAVVNLSLGSNDGPHDGTGSLESVLADLGKEALICVAAGNEGDNKLFVGKKFTSADKTLKTFFTDNKSSGVDIWTNGSDPITVKVALYQPSTKMLTDIATVTSAGQSVSANSQFSTTVGGTFTMVSEVNRRNNRFHVSMSGVFGTKTSTSKVALIVEGSEGQQVYVYGYGSGANPTTTFSSGNLSGYTEGSTDGSISGTACGENIIAVGSYNSRITWPMSKEGYYYEFKGGYNVDDVSPFSSFGTNYQGVSLPVVCAPGAAIVSSYNRYYTQQMDAETLSSNTSAKVMVSGSTLGNYWGELQGTSMACPYVAGTVALWLEADPTLDVNTVKDIIKTTSISPSSTGAMVTPLKRKQWGGGRLDALAGIKEVLRRKAEAGVDGVLADAGGYVITPVGDRSYNVVVDGADRLTARLYNMQGVAVAIAHGQGGELTLDASGVARGVYILAVETPNTAPVTRRLRL